MAGSTWRAAAVQGLGGRIAGLRDKPAIVWDAGAARRRERPDAREKRRAPPPSATPSAGRSRDPVDPAVFVAEAP
jgi:hypothetical protein